MSRLSRYLRTHPPSGWISFVLIISKATNVALLFLGIAMMAYAGDLWATINSPSDPPASWSEVRWPASAIVFAAMGLALCVTACAGLGAAARYSFFLLNCNLGLLALTMAGQVCLAAVVASSDGGAPAPGRQVSSYRLGLRAVSAVRGAAGVRRELRDALLAYKVADAVAAGVEVAALLFGCLLHSAFTRADERAEDAEEGLSDPSAPLLVSRRRAEARGAAAGRRTQVPPRVRRNDSWSRHMREQYGLDTSMLSYNPQAAPAGGGAAQEAGEGPAGAGGGGQDAAGSRRCVIS